MTDAYQEPRSVADEVKLLFNSFDHDRNGKISVVELKEVLQSLDKDAWTDEAVSELLSGADTNADGELQFTEFWSWINGHGSSSPSHVKFREDVMADALEHDKTRWQKSQDYQKQQELKRLEKERKEEEKRRKEAERENHDRITRQQFIEERVQIGISKQVAQSMFAKGDNDGDGEIDRQELGWLATDQACTVQQIKGIFKQSHELADEDAIMDELVRTFTCWDKDGDGTVSCEELIRVIQTLNPRMGEKTANAMVQQADTNGDGFIDIHEFVGWIAGMNPKKKKAKEVHEARLGLAVHRKRAKEAMELGLQAEFEEVCHESYPRYCATKRIPTPCGTLNKGPGPVRLCKTCHNRHAWLCHGCGFVSYYDECVNGCGFGTFGWTCLQGDCKKKCGCKRKEEFWQRKGFVQSIDSLSVDVKRLLKLEEKEEEVKAEGEEEAEAAEKKDDA